MTTTVLIIEEPDGNKAIDISSPEIHRAVALAIVKARYDIGYYPEPPLPNKPELSQAEIRKLPDQFRTFGMALWQRYREDLARWNGLHATWTNIRVCIDTHDGQAAIDVLDSRRQFEGENFQILEVHPSY